MSNIFSALSRGLHNIFGVISGINIGDVLVIILLSLLIYKAFQLVRETHAGQLMKGVIYLLIANIFVNLFDMSVMQIILRMVWEIGFIAIIILFQPELRQLLEKLGKSKIAMLGRTASAEEDELAIRSTIDNMVKACVSMSETKTGALMVVEQTTILNDVVSSGSKVDAAVSRDLLCNIFYPKSPLHDGAVVIRENRIHSASCILPLTQNTDVSRELGTRHRAAIGMSERSDGVVVVVSEETGIISIANKGELKRGFDSITLKTELEALLIGDRFEKNESKIKVWKRWSK